MTSQDGNRSGIRTTGIQATQPNVYWLHAFVILRPAPSRRPATKPSESSSNRYDTHDKTAQRAVLDDLRRDECVREQRPEERRDEARVDSREHRNCSGALETSHDLCQRGV